VTDRKNGRILFDRPKPTVGCSASGRRRILNLQAEETGAFGRPKFRFITILR
jgi:hypothetical protein